MLLYIALALTLCFAFINGFHDGGNVIATIICSKSMRPMKALIGAALAEFVGPLLLGTAVAHTMGVGIMKPELLKQLLSGNVYLMIIAGVGGAIIWNLATWFLGLPSSSSHALIGGLLGAGITSAGISAVAITNVVEMVLLPLLITPLIGFVFGIPGILVDQACFTGARSVGRYFVTLQTPSMLFLAGTHGSNDAQKSMGVIAILLAAASGTEIGDFHLPEWVVVSCAAAVALGLSFGGWRIVKTVGYGICRLEPVHSFASQLTATTVWYLRRLYWVVPLAQARALASSVMGVGASHRLSAVRWPVTANIAYAWIFTVPISAVLSAGVCWILEGLIRV